MIRNWSTKAAHPPRRTATTPKTFGFRVVASALRADLGEFDKHLVMYIFFLTAGLICALPATSVAEENTVPPATEATVTLRDPFWPIGHVRTNAPVAAKTNRVQETQSNQTNGEVRIDTPPPPPAFVYKWDEAQKLIPIRGRYWDSVTKQYMVSIGGRWHTRGEFVTALHEGLLYRWRVTELTKDNVRLAKVDAVPPSKGEKR